MDNRKLKFIKEKNTLPNSRDIKFIFTGKKKGNKLHLKYAIKPLKLKNTASQDRRSLDVGINHGLHTRPGIGLYPVPTGRILRQYAQDHGLLPVTKREKKILDQLPLSLYDILKNPRPKQKKISHEQRERMPYHEIVSTSPKRYMDPFADADKDGVVNMSDCRPLNKHKQHVQLDPEEYDVKGNTLPPKASKSQKIMDNTDFMPVKGGRMTTEVPVRQQEIETYEEPEEDQLGWKEGKGSEKASKNITRITKKWKIDQD